MKKYRGKGVCGAVAMGRTVVLKRRESVIEQSPVADIPGEMVRLESARASARERLQEIRDRAVSEVGEEKAGIFEVHKMLLDDDEYIGFIRHIMESECVNAEYAAARAAEHFEERFAAMEDADMRARAADVRDVSERLLADLRGERRGLWEWEGKAIVCAADLTPSETMSLAKDRVLALVTAQGASNSHTAILARSRNIPTVIGVGDDFLTQVRDGSQAIVDGSAGEVILDPDRETCDAFLKRQRADAEKKRLLQELKDRESVTLDGRKVRICANIGGLQGLREALQSGAEGIGLFRSESLYLEKSGPPTEEQQFAVYKETLERMADRKTIIRTLDIGADKRPDYFGLKKEENPALGFRAIRICLARPEVFKTQLRALYRASVYGSLGILFPMITGVPELERVLEICGEVKAELRSQGISYSENVELGIMIETPAAAIVSDRLAPLVDFFSVGTNDLTQYTLACDRQNPDVEPFVDPHHEAILRLIEMSAGNAHRHGSWIGICGELAADTSLTETFLRMGIDELSVSPADVLGLRDAVRSLNLSK